LKIGICFLYKGEIEQAESIFNIVMNENCETYYDLFIEIIDSYINVEEYEKVIEILVSLLKIDIFNTTENLKKLANCYKILNEFKKSISIYEQSLVFLIKSIK
jgi:tetratricopeptide (TPR) repeat protein